MRARDLFLLAAVAASAACSDSDSNQPGPAELAAKTLANPTADAAQARAAQMLSLSGSAPAIEQSDYAGTLECAASLGLFMNSIENSPLIDDSQVDALRRAYELFRDRTFEKGVAEGMARREVSADLERTAEEAKDDSAGSSQTAIGCIRGLAGEAQRVPGGA